MDWTRIARISKAMTAGCTGAVTSAGAVAVVYATVPSTNAMPWWLWTGLPVGSAVFGFLAGFSATFAAPPNGPPKT